MASFTFTFADGSTLNVRRAVNDERGTGWRQSSIDMVIGMDQEGEPVARDPHGDMEYLLTLCCGASYKGMESYVGCRACYREVDGGGMPWGEVIPRVG